MCAVRAANPSAERSTLLVRTVIRLHPSPGTLASVRVGADGACRHSAMLTPRPVLPTMRPWSSTRASPPRWRSLERRSVGRSARSQPSLPTDVKAAALVTKVASESAGTGGEGPRCLREGAFPPAGAPLSVCGRLGERRQGSRRLPGGATARPRAEGRRRGRDPALAEAPRATSGCACHGQSGGDGDRSRNRRRLRVVGAPNGPRRHDPGRHPRTESIRRQVRGGVQENGLTVCAMLTGARPAPALTSPTENC